MYLFLRIHITDNQFDFSNEMLSSVKKQHPHLTVFDIDNFSDATTIQTAVRALGESEKAFVVVEAKEGIDLGATLKVLSYLIKVKVPLAIYYIGEHEMIDRIMIRFNDQLMSSDKSLNENLSSFLMRN